MAAATGRCADISPLHGWEQSGWVLADMTCVVAALYQFVSLPDYQQLREPLLEFCREQDIRGTLLLAPEGINGTIAGDRSGIDAVLARLRSDPRFASLEHKESLHEKRPFLRMKVKLKREIVTLGVAGVDPNRLVGTYVAPEDWNSVVDDPQVTLVDTRNDYECAIGSFRGAVDPSLTNFREFPQWVEQNLDPEVNRKVAMFCTGGIRCEKASSYLLEQGFEEVLHLRGGILKYLEEVPRGDSSWEGECFVFDDRVAVDHDLKRGSFDQCFACRHPVRDVDKESPLYEEGVSCPYCHDQKTQEKRAGLAERQRQIALASARGETHIGQPQTVSRIAQVEQT
jgi:UPF0176 protein